jgi:hypothetical protein
LLADRIGLSLRVANGLPVKLALFVLVPVRTELMFDIIRKQSRQLVGVFLVKVQKRSETRENSTAARPDAAIGVISADEFRASKLAGERLDLFSRARVQKSLGQAVTDNSRMLHNPDR